MKRAAYVVHVAAVAAVAACTATGPSTTPAPPPNASGALAAMPAPAAAGVVVVELFTSQGCSSCPPADALLTELVRADTRAGAAGAAPLIALAFHVDYWNRLGWVDPFSSAIATARQERYAAHLGARGPYTPQLVIGGRRHVVGSQRAEVAQALRAATLVPTLAVTVTRDGDMLRVQAPVSAGDHAELAVWEDGLTTQVTDGENGGATLTNDRVVRAVVALDGVGAATVRLAPAWRREGLGAVVLVHDADEHVVAAATVAVTP